MDLNKSLFIKNYIADALKYAKFVNPNLDCEKFVVKLKERCEREIKIGGVKLINSYKHIEEESDILSVLDWLEEVKPILTEKGSVYKQHREERNPCAEILADMKARRKKEKKKMLKAGEEFGKTSAQYRYYDISQNTEKKNMNSYYGASGAPSSIFYNLYIALSITGKGQSIISNAMSGFEKLLSGNVYYTNIDDIISHVMEMLQTSSNDNILDILDEDKVITKEQLLDRWESQMYSDVGEYKFDDVEKEYLNKLIDAMSKEQLNKMYYKNNLIEFSKNSKIVYLIKEIMYTFGKLDFSEFKIQDGDKWKYRVPQDGKDFPSYVLLMDPNERPDIIKPLLDNLIYLMREFVMDFTPAFDRINNLIFRRRKRVITIDTDSNFVNLNEWYEYSKNLINENKPEIYNLNETEERICLINIMGCICTEFINNHLFIMTKSCNVEDDEKASLIRMKNEFLIKRILTMEAKKNYASLVLAQEGTVLSPPYMDIKGSGLIKSGTNSEIGERLSGILKKYILEENKIRPAKVIQELHLLEKDITESVKKETKYLKPAKVNHENGYKNPYSIPGYNGVMVWNLLYPNDQIQLPNMVKLVKLKLEKLIDAQKMASEFPDIFDTLYKNIYTNKNPAISGKGVVWLAIPDGINKIPDWAIPYINYDYILNASISPFLPILLSLGINTLNTYDSDTVYSNILNF